MTRRVSVVFAVLVFSFALSMSALAQEWNIRKARGTLKVVDLFSPSVSVMRNYAEGLLTTDKDNNLVPCLAEDWRWADERTIE